VNRERTVIIGGGIVGLASAYYLAKGGRPVTLVEQGTVPQSASTGNAGIVALGHLPLPRPGLARKAVGWMLDNTSPLYIPPRLDPGLALWLWQFYRSCNRAHVTHCMNVLGELGRLSVACWEEILAAEGIDCSWQRRGWLDVYRTAAGSEHAAADARTVASHGFAAHRRTGEELRREDPAFGDGVLGAVHYSESAFLDPVRFLSGLGARLAGLGVELRENATVRRLLADGDGCTGVELASGERLAAETTVLTAGAWSTQLAQTIGVRVPMQAGKGYHLDLTAPDPCVRTACVLTETFVAVTPMGDRLRLAGTLEFSGVNRRLVRKRLELLHSGAAGYLRGIEGARVVGEGCDLRPCTADGLPVVGWAPRVRGLFVATGHAKMGLTLGPGTGKLVSEHILGRTPSVETHALRADRF
jgi:D-amino-acid dehydrogenase